MPHNFILNYLLFAIIIFVNIFWVFGFFVRVIGIETKKWALSNSIFQVLNLIPQTLSILQVPLITYFTESAINKNLDIEIVFYQLIILFNLVGIFIAILLMPFFMNYFRSIIGAIYINPNLLVFISKKHLFEFKIHVRLIDYLVHNLSIYSKVKYRRMFYYNIIIGYLLAIAFPICVYIGYQLPAYRATIISLVAVIIGIGTYINILFVETKIAQIGDKTFHQELEFSEYKYLLVNSFYGRIIGLILGLITIESLSQFILFQLSNLGVT